MPIVVDCPVCSRKLRVPNSAAGKTGKCPSCNAPVAVPQAASDEPFSAIDLDDDDSLVGHIPKKPDPPSDLPPIFPPLPAAPASVTQSPGTTPRPQQFVPPPRPTAMRVVVVDFDMSFTNMVIFMIKWALAAIPAAIILVGIVGIALMAFLMAGMMAGVPRGGP
jgi:hypothetical protein